MADDSGDQPASKAASRAKPELSMQRVEHIADLMTSGEWVPGESDRRLAVEWGLSPRRVGELATQASRAIKLAWDQEGVQAAILAKIAAIGRAAENRTEEVVDKDGCVHEVKKPDLRTALKAAELLGHQLGMLKHRHEVTHRYEQMSDDELAGELRKYLGPVVETEGEESRH